MTEEKMNLSKKMDKALHYLAKNIRETGTNSKPILLHSFKVAYQLYEFDYEETIVIGAILHDLIEDTAIEYADIVNEYGTKVADIVQAVSFDPQVEDKLKQADLMFKNCIDYGVEATVIKCSDLIDNINFLSFVEDKEKRNNLLKKHELFLEMTEKTIGNTKIYSLLVDKVKDRRK